MKKILYWIDDTHDKFKPPQGETKRRIEDGLDVTLTVLQIAKRLEFDRFLPTIKPDRTAGIILDYQLTAVGEVRRKALGNVWASEIRAVAPSVPVIGISHENIKKIPKLRLESFLEFYPREVLLKLHPPLEDLSALLTGYCLVFELFEKYRRRRGIQLLVELVSPPESSLGLFEAAIPAKLVGLWDTETPHVAGRWIWHTLLGRPGLLFDDLGLATCLGLSLSGLAAVAKHFESASYQGAFASAGRCRWWVSGIRPLVESIVGDPVIGPVSSARDELLNKLKVPTQNRSKLMARAFSRPDHDVIPDCVAYRDEECEEKDRVQALAEDTCVDMRDENMPFGFEARRVFKSSSNR